MTEALLARAKPVFQALVDLDPDESTAFLSELCGEDEQLRSFVERLLAHYRRGLGGFLETADARAATTAEAAHALLGSLGPYKVLGKLGEGASAVVFAAEQSTPFRRRVALKILKAGMDTTAVLARFEMERQALALMDHPNIAKVFDAGETERGRPYFVMEYVAGVPVTEHCNTLRLDVTQRLELFIRICDGIQHAHQKAVIHRDVKPSNVLVAIRDGVAVPKVIDFGIAKALAHPLTTRVIHTELGQLIGTPVYMSPEQAEMTAQGIDTRTDVYSLGALLYELLVDEPPFDPSVLRRGGLEMIRRTLREVEPPRPSTRVAARSETLTRAARNRRTTPAGLVGQLRGDLDRITMKALAKDRARRYASPSELAADVHRHMKHEPVVATPPSTPYRMRKFIRRHRIAVSIAAASFLSLAGFAAFAWTQARIIAAERDRANQEAASARQVSEFLTRLFEIADPSEARGKPITAVDILDTGARRAREELGEQPEVQARLLDTIGTLYWKLGLFGQAQPLLEQALVTRRRLMGEEHPETLSSMNRLATVYIRQRRFAGAESLLVAASEGRRRELGGDDLETLRCLNNLGVLYKEQGRYAEAERLYRETLDARRRILGDDHVETLLSKNNLAVLLKARGRYAEAEPLYLESLETQRRTLGDDHPETLATVHNVANLYVAENRPDEAESLFLAAVRGKARVLGPRHPSTNNTRYALACLMAVQGRTDEAIRWLREALDHGYSDLWIADDADLSSLHGDPAFEDIVAEVRRRN